MKKRMKKLNSKGIITDYLPWLIIGLAVLVIMLVAIFFMKDAGESWITKLKDIFRGR